MAQLRGGQLVGGRYRLERPLAAGGMGTVWVARHVDLETDVAVKLVSRAHARRPDLLERFRREARAAAQLKTPHVVQILDYGVDEGVPYIAMELLDGEDLEALLDREVVLSPARALSIVRPLCKALTVAHAAGIVHRDLKPANVFMARIAGDEVVKIVDFGIAKELGRGAEWSTGALILGSPLFMSPEQIAGSGAVDTRTDIWSLSVIAYMAILGEPPFIADGVHAVMERVTRGEFVLPSAHAAGLAPLDEFFRRGLAREAEDRFPDVAALVAALEAAVGRLADPALAITPRALEASATGTLVSESGSPGAARGAASAELRPSGPGVTRAPEDATQHSSPEGTTLAAFGSATVMVHSDASPVVPPPPVRPSRAPASPDMRSSMLVAAACALAVVVAAFVAISPDDRGAAPGPAAAVVDAPVAVGRDARAGGSDEPAAASPPSAAAPAPSTSPSGASPSKDSGAAPAHGAARPTTARPAAPRTTSPAGTSTPPAKPPASAAKKPAPTQRPAVDPEWGVQVQP